MGYRIGIMMYYSEAELRNRPCHRVKEWVILWISFIMRALRTDEFHPEACCSCLLATYLQLFMQRFDKTLDRKDCYGA